MSSARWTADLRAGIRDGTDPRLPGGTVEVARRYKVRVPQALLARIGSPDDPLGRQYLPDARELEVHPAELADPIGDERHAPVSRLTHRYPDRVLLYPTYQCAVYCRYCFRKERLNAGNDGFSREALEPALAYLEGSPQVREVVLTGGDPLLLPDDALRWLRERLEAVPHLRLLRVHTRIPVALPDRITPGLVDALEGRLMTVVVTHVNHAREITPAAATATRRLRKAGFLLLNQSVLLKGVNDTPEALEQLCRELLYTLGAKPYYLHHPDLTRGTTHFRTTIDEGLALVASLRGRLSGLAQPLYVLDLPGGEGKVPLGPSWIEAREAGRWLFRTWRGGAFAYEEVLSEPAPASAPGEPGAARPRVAD